MHLGWSSCVYPLEADDVAAAPDYDGEPIPAADLPDDPVLLLLRRDRPDCLLRGRDVVARAAGGTVGVRVVFVPTVAKWNLAATLVRVLRNRHRFHGTGVYHIAASAVRALGLERAIRTLDNPQLRGKVDRHAKMRKLEESLRTRGYDDARPINVMLCRTGGKYDSLRQGHHRVSACLALGVERMAVEFSAAGALPRALGHLPRPPSRAVASRNRGFRLSSLAARVEDAFGVKVAGLKGLPGRSHSLNYRVSTADGAAYSVKLTPSRHGEKWSRLLAHARSVQCPLAAGLAFPAADVAFEGFQILCFQWKDGRSRAFDKLSEEELSGLLAAHRAFLAGLSDDGHVLPAYDLAAARAGLLERVAGGTANGIRRELESLDPATFRRVPERTRVIHGDLNPANVLFRDGKVSGVLDVEELRFGVPAEDLVRFVVCGAEHLKFYQFGRLRRFVRRFEALVRAAGVPAEDWLLAINAALLRKLQRHVRGPRVPLLTRVRLQFRFRFYRSLRGVVRRVAAGGEGMRVCSV